MGPPHGFLVPEWYQISEVGDLDFHIASVIWGFSLGVAVYTMTKGVSQTYRSFKKGRVFNGYIIMVWAEWGVSLIISVISWCFLNPNMAMPPSFWLFFGIRKLHRHPSPQTVTLVGNDHSRPDQRLTVILWAIQVQCIIQILINRVRLLMVDQNKGRRLHWIGFMLVGLINISVFIIWIPARLQISPRWEMINEYWDRIEKAVFGIIDICLNLYFLYLVRTKLIENGLMKYESLFRYNLFMAFLSVSMDVSS
jgi:hypothetical protein